MAVPGLLIEYLLNGVLALVWLYPLLKKYGLAEISASYLPLFAIGLYFVGMVVDIAAWVLVRPVKRKLRKYLATKYGFSAQYVSGSSHARQVKFAIYAPEVAKEFAMRSSRDRIARGAIINSALATIFVFPLLPGLVAILVSFAMWIGFEKVSFSYELIAERAIDEKIDRDKNKPHS